MRNHRQNTQNSTANSLLQVSEKEYTNYENDKKQLIIDKKKLEDEYNNYEDQCYSFEC